jgi:hypothetical protein
MAGEEKQGSAVQASTTTQETVRLDLSAQMREIIQSRLQSLDQLDQLEFECQRLAKSDQLDDDTRKKLLPLFRDIRSLSAADAAKLSEEQIDQRIEQYAKEPQLPDDAPAPHPIMIDARRLSLKQWELFKERRALLPDVIKCGMPFAVDEPLFKLLHQFDLDPEKMFGLTYYALGVEAVSGEQMEETTKIRRQIKELGPEKRTVMQKVIGKKGEDEDTRTRLKRKEKEVSARMSRTSKELLSVVPMIVEEFWRIYEELAVLYVTDPEVGASPVARAFLRYGVTGSHPALLPEASYHSIMESCKEGPAEWAIGLDNHTILYADEYFHYVATARITPAIDEEMELNQRKSPAWVADKAWRRMIHARMKKRLLDLMSQDLARTAMQLKTTQTESESAREELDKKDRDFRQKREAHSKVIQSCRVESAQMVRLVEKIRKSMMETQDEAFDKARARFAETDITLTPADLIRREAQGLRRIAKLCAHMKENYPAFELREYYRPDDRRVNDRESMQAEFEEVERRDPKIFRDYLSPDTRRKNITLRYAPIVVLIPGAGTVGYSWNPRKGPENGRLAFPVMCPRSDIRKRVLYDMLADFRWDTSTAEAGVDLLTSDTLVAAYANCRWIYRQKPKEIREKAYIDNEETDRKNWRRHYQLYMESALDAGKKLYFKSQEIYNAVLRYLDLPEGLEKIKK